MVDSVPFRGPAARVPDLALRLVRRRELPLALVLLAVAAVYAPSLGDYFHGDDFVALAELSARPALPHLLDVITFQDGNFYWRPLGEVYYQLVYETAGLDPVAFRLGGLAFFLGSIVLLYVLCRRMRLPEPVALGACFLFGLFPNHVVSVAWITNAPRLMAVFFLLASLVAVESAVRTQRLRIEALAWLLFLLACLSDETALALAPVPLIFSLTVRPEGQRWLTIAGRGLAYGAVAASLIPLQFMFTTDDEPRLADYQPGWHLFDQTWALASQLALPLRSGGPMAESFARMDVEQWMAGGLALFFGLVLVFAGSRQVRFLVLWTGFAIAPFTLWDIPWVSARYVYMAAPPFAVVAAWLGYALWQAADRFEKAKALRLTVALVVLATLAFLGGLATVKRNAAWGRASEPYRVLANGLKQAVPEVEPGSRIVIYYGVWEGFPLWPNAVARTVYKDESIRVMNIGRTLSENEGPKRQYGDVVLYYADGRFIALPPSAGLRQTR